MKNTIVFSGHMIDAMDRDKPRFPASIEPQVKAMILQELIKKQPVGLAIAGAASGGDILFHECCMELGIKSEIIIADEVEIFLRTSVLDAGKEWVERYRRLVSNLPVNIVKLDANDPPEINLFSKTNQKMIHYALRNSSVQTYLIVVLDTLQTGRQGGTFEMMQEAEKASLSVIIIELSKINGSL